MYVGDNRDATEYLDPKQQNRASGRSTYEAAGGYVSNPREQVTAGIPLHGNASGYEQARNPGTIEMDEYQYMGIGGVIKSPNPQNFTNEQHYETTIVKSAEHRNPEQTQTPNEYEDIDKEESVGVHEYSEPTDVVPSGLLEKMQLSQSNSDKNEYEYIEESKNLLPPLIPTSNEPHYATTIVKDPKLRKFSLEEGNPIYDGFNK